MGRLEQALRLLSGELLLDSNFLLELHKPNYSVTRASLIFLISFFSLSSRIWQNVRREETRRDEMGIIIKKVAVDTRKQGKVTLLSEKVSCSWCCFSSERLAGFTRGSGLGH